MRRRPRLHLALLATAICVALLALVPIAIAAGGGGTIAFSGVRPSSSDRGIFTVPGGGGQAKRIASGDEPAISGDGSTVIYVGASGGGSKFPWIYAINSDGTQRRRLASPNFEVSNPVWEQGGGVRFAYVGDLTAQGPGQKNEGRQIFVSDVSGEARQVTHDEEPGRDISYEPSFAPNSNKIVFTHLSSRGSELVSVRISGTDRTVLVRSGALMNPSHASYSPDGSRIVFQATVNSGGNPETNVYTVDANTGNDLEKVNKGDGEAREPAYSPDGKSIVFRRGGNLFTMATDGAEVEQLTNLGADDGANSQPSWGR